ncbi:NADPH:quinone oxidoreductase family protein [Acidovorax sp. MR-S7]|uniref:NADPH:quinone oxidoreductase family protein n=1 Tax=Acidovorax sp. MR-S7 TaxID=1268622 RepID=UPI0005551936|nr:NADPH:quinone oxidoreductase family protein [Acidovorax sp. MR-S7]
MKAIVCRKFTGIDDLSFEDVGVRPLGQREVRVRSMAAGVNFPDILKVCGRYQVRPTLPWIPGGEAAGIVTEVGAEVESIAVDDRVVIVSDIAGGAFAEEIVVTEERVLRLPESISFVEAAATPVVYGTVLYALRQRAQLEAGESLLVLGASGGVGLAAVQVGKAMGARVIAAASTRAKCDLAAAHGAESTVIYADQGWREVVKDATEGRGVDVTFDPVGGDAFDEAIRCMAWMGRYMAIGFASGRIPTLQINHPLLKSYDLRGVRYDVWRDRFWPQARVNLETLLQWQVDGRIRPHVSATYSLSDAKEAMRRIAGRQVVGKVVLVPG